MNIDFANIDWMYVVNLIFCLIILILGVRRSVKTGKKTFLLIALGFTMYAISHVCKILGIAGEPVLKEALIVIRSIGYILVIIGIIV